MPKAKVELVKLDDLILDPAFQMREPQPDGEVVNKDHVADLHAALRKKVKLPRPKATRIKDRGLVITDGWHTVTAHIAAHPAQKIEVEITEGSELEATIAAATSPQHAAAGLKWKPADRRRAVRQLLLGLRKAGVKWPRARVAEQVGVSDDLVQAVIDTLPDPTPDPETPPEPEYAERKNGVKQKVRKYTKREPKPSSNGAATHTYDWKAAEAAMGVIQRCPDDVKRAHPGAESLTECGGFVRMLKEVAETFSVFKKAVQKTQK